MLNPKHILACDACGHDNSNSMFAKNEYETCRQFGCFGKMKWMPKEEAATFRVQMGESAKEFWIRPAKNKNRLIRHVLQ